MYLTIIDTAGIQDFIFSTNKLKQIVGASHLVNCAQHEWVKECLDALDLTHNILDNATENVETWVTNKRIEADKLDAELVYSGGGNTLLLFSSGDNAIRFTQKITRKVIEEAPGLRLVISHYPFDWDNDALGGEDGVLQKAFNDLAKRKCSSLPVTSEPGQGVMAQCAYTDLPAVIEENNILLSSMVNAKIKAEMGGHKRIERTIRNRDFVTIPKEIDELGGSQGEKNLLAVVHIDGNGMGDRVAMQRNAFPNAPQNRDCIIALREFSFSIRRVANESLQETIDFLIGKIDQDKKIAGVITVKEGKLPFRPIVFGGDDLTFVCDGRLGLSLATHYLQTIANKSLSDEHPLYCRAGVAIVHAHFPFSRAYSLAEELCKSAKDRIKEITKEARDQNIPIANLEWNGISTIDWHYAVGGFLGGLSGIRSREYTTKIGKLNMRPLVVNLISPPNDGRTPTLRSGWRNWNNFVSITQKFSSGESWNGKHNKVKALRQSLREGKSEVIQFCKIYRVDLPEIDGESSSGGWIGNNCAYYDAVEAIDSFIQL